MRGNVFAGSIKGRDAIARVLTQLEGLYASVADIDCATTPDGEFIFSQARLFSGEKMTIKIAGIRDKSGWIAKINMFHAPKAAMHVLARQLAAASSSGSRAA